MKKVSAVNYVIEPCEGSNKQRVVNVNLLKKFHERELEVCALTVIAEDHRLEESLTNLKENKCEGYKEKELLGVLSGFEQVMSAKPGKTSIV